MAIFTGFLILIFARIQIRILPLLFLIESSFLPSFLPRIFAALSSSKKIRGRNYIINKRLGPLVKAYLVRKVSSISTHLIGDISDMELISIVTEVMETTVLETKELDMVSIPVAENICNKRALHTGSDLMSKDISYQKVINFQRSSQKGRHICVMCGKENAKDCIIPCQNKDVCKNCDCRVWFASAYDVEFKFCKGRFLFFFSYTRIMHVIYRLQKLCLFS